ncbi:MAG: pilus assembly protein PilM, partial [Candidatus Wallbacteria bacterium]|nr:pilus assembly protein PilM [Candidatus Wallbacteria bacterium]
EEAGLVLEKYAELDLKRDDLLKFSGLDLLTAYIEENKLQDHYCVLCVSGTSIIIRYILLPKIPVEELPTAVPFESKKELPFSLEEAELDYFIVGEVEKEGVKKLKAFVAAYKKEELQKYYQLFERLGLKLSSIVVTPPISENLIKMQGGKISDEIIAHIDIGYQTTSVNILNCGGLDFSRVIPMGSFQIDELIAENLAGNPLQVEGNLEKASRLKIENGLTGSDEKVVEWVRDGINNLLQRVRLSIGYYKTQTGAKKIDRVLLTGGLAGLKGIAPYLKDNLEANVELLRLEPNPELSISPEFSGLNTNLFATVIGGVIENKGSISRINLLAKYLRPKKEVSLSSSEDIQYFYKEIMIRLEKMIPNPKLLFTVIYAGLFILMLVPYLFLNTSKIYYSSKSADYSTNLNQLSTKLEQAVALRNEFKNLEIKVREKASIFQGKRNWSEIMVSLSHTFTEEVIVDSLNFKMEKNRNYSFTLSGKTGDTNMATMAAIDLGKNKYFSDEVALEDTMFSEGNAAQNKKRKLLFSLKGSLKNINYEK